MWKVIILFRTVSCLHLDIAAITLHLVFNTDDNWRIEYTNTSKRFYAQNSCRRPPPERFFEMCVIFFIFLTEFKSDYTGCLLCQTTTVPDHQTGQVLIVQYMRKCVWKGGKHVTTFKQYVIYFFFTNASWSV